MTTIASIDEEGRLVLPASIRGQLSRDSQMTVEILENGLIRIILAPAHLKRLSSLMTASDPTLEEQSAEQISQLVEQASMEVFQAQYGR